MFDIIISYIVWDPSPEVIPGLSVPRWYSLFFAGGFIISYFIMSHFFKSDGKPVSDVDRLTFYMVLGTVIGARLGHVLFYEPERYLSNPIDIFKTWEGGLASHGAAIGILLALFLYARKTKGQGFLWIVDRIVVVVALTACLIRLGNFMNSEIGGKPTESSFGVVFARDAEEILKRRIPALENVEAMKGEGEFNATQGTGPLTFKLSFKRANLDDDMVSRIIETDVKNLLAQHPYLKGDIAESPETPISYRMEKQGGIYTVFVDTQGIVRHPTQLYEAFAYLLIFFLLYYMWHKHRKTLPDGVIFGTFLIVLWSARFVMEFLKENQVEFEDSMSLNMGQILSIPLILAGVVLIIWAYSSQRKNQGTGS
jgi:phosphatidylglycerol---prolipoprotein diacylglyceryl transferase